jgi:hypothetical protein
MYPLVSPPKLDGYNPPHGKLTNAELMENIFLAGL